MVLRILLSLTTSCGISVSIAAGFATGASARGPACEAEAAPGFRLSPESASTSAFTIRPFGPVPATEVRSRPLLLAIRLASGLAFTRSLLSDDAGLAAVACGRGAVAFGTAACAVGTTFSAATGGTGWTGAAAIEGAAISSSP